VWRLVRFVQRALPLADVLLCGFTYPAALLLKFIRWAGIERMPLCRRVLLRVGVFPIRNHYYEPLFDASALPPWTEARSLPGIDWNRGEQLSLLASFDYADEIRREFTSWRGTPRFYFANASFDAGDAEFWYSFIRSRKPKRILEVGGGFSTLIARRAAELNMQHDPAYTCEHICIEPYEAPWLEQLGVRVMRERVETLDLGLFQSLDADDVLFIDSSHVIRRQGDVLFEILEVLPRLRPGVVVHLHDIFTPRDYPDSWIRDKVLFWNEQYLLEAFLTNNRDWKIIGAVNDLHHEFPEQLKAKCPFVTPQHEPGSFYLQNRSI